MWISIFRFFVELARVPRGPSGGQVVSVMNCGGPEIIPQMLESVKQFNKPIYIYIYIYTYIAGAPALGLWSIQRSYK